MARPAASRVAAVRALRPALRDPVSTVRCWSRGSIAKGAIVREDDRQSGTDARTSLTAIGEVRRIITAENPPSSYFGQVIWTTVMQASVEGFLPNPVSIAVCDFWTLRQAA